MREVSMDTKQNNSPDISEVKRFVGRPSWGFVLMFAFIAAVSAVLVPELGLLSPVLISASVIFTISAGANFIIALIPLVGAGAAYFRGGLYVAAVCAVFVIASVISGYTLKKHGFFRALVMYTLVVYGAAVVAIALYTKICDISAAALTDGYRAYFGQILEASISTYSKTIPAENVAALTEMYDLALEVMVLYAPVLLAWLIEICGVISIRLVGFFHNFAGSTMYPLYKRFAFGDRVFGFVFLAALILGFMDNGIVGICAVNVMLVLLVPAVCSGVSVNRRMLAERRERGMRGIPPSLLIVLISIFMSPIIGLAVLGFTGAVDALKKKRPPQR